MEKANVKLSGSYRFLHVSEYAFSQFILLKRKLKYGSGDLEINFLLQNRPNQYPSKIPNDNRAFSLKKAIVNKNLPQLRSVSPIFEKFWGRAPKSLPASI